MNCLSPGRAFLFSYIYPKQGVFWIFIRNCILFLNFWNDSVFDFFMRKLPESEMRVGDDDFFRTFPLVKEVDMTNMTQVGNDLFDGRNTICRLHELPKIGFQVRMELFGPVCFEMECRRLPAEE